MNPCGGANSSQHLRLKHVPTLARSEAHFNAHILRDFPKDEGWILLIYLFVSLSFLDKCSLAAQQIVYFSLSFSDYPVGYVFLRTINLPGQSSG